MLIYESQSNINNGVAVNGYLPAFSQTVKGSAVSGVSWEVFDLGELIWKNLDYVVITSLLDESGGGTQLVTVAFSSSASALNSALEIPFSPPRTVLSGIGVGQTIRYAGTSSLNTIVTQIRVTQRYMRIWCTNGNVAQGSNAFWDVKGYSLTR